VILHCLEEDLRNRPASVLSVAAALPGGDPLAATLAAGETPSPEIAAAAGESELISVRTAVVCLAAVVVGVIAAALIFPECNLLSQTALAFQTFQSRTR
jgi:serine/threonine-protein kinase